MNLLVFGIMRGGLAAPECPVDPVSGRPVALLRADGLAAAYTVLEARKAPSVAEALAFAQVLGSLHQQGVVVPLRYGSWFDSEAEVESLLRRRQQAFAAALDLVEGCDEIGLHILPHEAFAPRVARASALAHEPPADPGRPGTTYLERLRARYSECDSSRTGADIELLKIMQALAGRYKRCHVAPSPPRGFPGLLSLVFLVGRADLGRFQDAVGALQEEPGGDRLRRTGPWPPYHFVDAPL